MKKIVIIALEVIIMVAILAIANNYNIKENNIEEKEDLNLSRKIEKISNIITNLKIF